jgi:hypothetical protein
VLAGITCANTCNVYNHAQGPALTYVQRSELHTAIIEAKRQFVAALGDFLVRARKAGIIAPKRDPRSLAAWWLSVVLGRYVIDVDADRFCDDEWTDTVVSTVKYLLAGER